MKIMETTHLYPNQSLINIIVVHGLSGNSYAYFFKQVNICTTIDDHKCYILCIVLAR